MIFYTGQYASCHFWPVNVWAAFSRRACIDRGEHGPSASYWLIPGTDQ